MKKSIMAFIAILFLSVCFLSTSLSFSEELMPKPGTVIDNSNYKKYAHLLPAELPAFFEDDYGLIEAGLMNPIVMKVGENFEYHNPKAYIDNSAANKGKYSLDSDGKLIGGWNRNGIPFPDLQRDDQDFVTKFMWNFSARYKMDDWQFPRDVSYMQRKGEKIRRTQLDMTWLFFVNRAVVPPLGIMESSENVAEIGMFHLKRPASMRNMIILSKRFMDLEKDDGSYTYVPSLRRVLRGDSGQRSVPMQGNISSLDDLNVFDGRTHEFTYKLVREQKLLVLKDCKWPDIWDLDVSLLPFPNEDYSIGDCWVVDITSKEANYPVSKKRIYLDKESYHIYCGYNWDRSGSLWKVWQSGFVGEPIPGEGKAQLLAGSWAVDLQFGLVNLVQFRPPKRNRVNVGGITLEDVNTASMLKRAR